MSAVAVIDYGMGNLRSVCKAIEHVAPKARVRLVTTAAEVTSADRVVFPGQGAIVGCMRALEQSGMRAAVLAGLRNKPFLGLCLGLQALYQSSEEGGGTPGLDVLPGKVRRFDFTGDGARQALKVPHMGWNQVHQSHTHPLWHGIPDGARFYFVHSYYADTSDPAVAVGITEYGVPFTSAAARENIFAVQFHPEKSQQAGLQLLANFVGWSGTA